MHILFIDAIHERRNISYVVNKPCKYFIFKHLKWEKRVMRPHLDDRMKPVYIPKCIESGLHWCALVYVAQFGVLFVTADRKNSFFFFALTVMNLNRILIL